MRWAWLLALAAAGIALFWLGGRDDSPPRPPSSPAELPDRAEFTGSATCRSCHGEEHKGWLATAHARALRPPDAVAGAFDGVPSGDATPRREASGFTVKVDPRDGRPPGNHRVTWVVGGRTEEAYLFTDARGAWRLLPIAWNVARKGWDETHAVYEALTGEAAPTDARQIVFNRGCAPCHATGFDPGIRFEPQGESYESTMAEPGVGCEACHGAGSVHAAWHEQEREGAYAPPAKLHGGASGACLRCHYAHEWRCAMPEDPGAPFEECAVSRNFDGRGFFPDGRLATDRHAGTTFVQSACARGGATCLSCHAMHGEARDAGNAQCTGCHDGFARKEHTFHEDVRCVDCHMPRLLGTPLERLRDHSIRSPEPVLTERFGVPNACNACHGDQTPAWAREWKEKWYGPADERMVADTAAIVALRAGRTEGLAEILRGPRSPLFFRATALRALPRGDPAVREALGAAEVDLIQLACETLAERPDPLAAPALVGLLRHPARTVRLEAAYALARAGWRGEGPGLREDVRALLGRQYPATACLVRAAWILDALGASDEMAILLQPIVERAPAEAAPLIERRGRALAQAGRHGEALVLYDDARLRFGEALPGAIYLDSADSLSASGDEGAAATVWRHAAATLDPSSDERAVAQARLLLVEGRGEEGRALLEPIERRLAEDPVGGEMLRRVRWSLDALAKR